MGRKNTVLALDAGGTNLVFNAVQNGEITNKSFAEITEVDIKEFYDDDEL